MDSRMSALFFLTVLTLSAAGPDTAVVTAFRQASADIAQVLILQRTSVSEELELVVAFGNHRRLPVHPGALFWWEENRKIGLFLQEKANVSSVYLLSIQAGSSDCGVRIERVTATDVVISCLSEKPGLGPRHKWLYDIRAKGLVRQFSYTPFETVRSYTNGDRVVLVGSDDERLVAFELDPKREPGFRIMNPAEAQRWTDRVGAKPTTGYEATWRKLSVPFEEPMKPPKGIPPVPQSTYDQFAVARPEKVKSGYALGQTRIEKRVGPWQREEGRIWFGKTFYDAEGITGVGGFGAYDSKARSFDMLTAPELADWSVSAILVEPEAVWLGLSMNGEYGDLGGGLLRYDRTSGTYRRLALPDVIQRIVRVGEGRILLATNSGAAVVEGGVVRRFFVDRLSDGRLRVAEGTQ